MATIVHEQVPSLTSSRQFVPNIGLIRLSSGYVARETSPAKGSALRRLDLIRQAVAVATMAVPVAFLIHFLVLGGGIDAYTFHGTLTEKAVDLVVGPALALVAWTSLPRPVYGGCDLVVAGLGLISLAARQLLLRYLDKLGGDVRSRGRRRVMPKGRASMLGVPMRFPRAVTRRAELGGEQSPAQGK
jgi:hypothetical protein